MEAWEDMNVINPGDPKWKDQALRLNVRTILYPSMCSPPMWIRAHKLLPFVAACSNLGGSPDLPSCEWSGKKLGGVSVKPVNY